MRIIDWSSNVCSSVLAAYGGSTTAILVNLPGETSSVVTIIDGYQMARRGRAGVAIATAAIASFSAGCVGTIVVAAFAAPLATVAYRFGAAEYFSLMVVGLIGAVSLSSGSIRSEEHTSELQSLMRISYAV